MKDREVVHGWLNEIQTPISVELSKWKIFNFYEEKFNAWHEIDKHLIKICCSNNVDCLNIIVLNKNTKKDCMVSGEFNRQMGDFLRLIKLLAWFETTQ